MEKEKLLELYDRELRIEIEIPGVEKQTFPRLVRFIRPAPGMNFILYSHLEEAELVAVISKQVQDLAPLPQPFTWQVFEHDRPSSLQDRLVEFGFVRSDDPDAIMILEIDRARLPRLKPHQAEVRRVVHADQLEQVASLEQGIYGGDFSWLIKRLSDDMQIANYLSLYLVYVNDEPVCAGWIFFHPKSQFASLYGGATAMANRGRGYYQAIVAARVQEAIDRGYRFVTTGASTMSRPILMHNGFEQLTVATDFEWKRKLSPL